ncbi:MAG: fumarylacetoacetate hydrolase family protein [Spirochaetales bacterium]|jgi:2-keto-4-pentenoate hydratase/2-oxohepta-3-ene-1,7-dioic acid hydratase in catechol pathway|nr:fumarylacetoacetate hydrolase family protein [Spirochaetales bacterium]
MITLPVYKTNTMYTIQPSKIIALGLNYREHVKESQSAGFSPVVMETPGEPILFAKTPNVLVGPEEPILIPAILGRYDFKPRVDYEAELAFIIKDRCKNVPEDEAFAHIYGFTCMNDVSQRNLQKGEKAGWFRGKSFDTFGPIGPHVVLTRDIGDAQNLNICCRLNGETVQSSNTREMIFSIAATLSFISQNFTLEPGDIITTGTPSGVGPVKPGDVVEIEIENIGILRNPVKAE